MRSTSLLCARAGSSAVQISPALGISMELCQFHPAENPPLLEDSDTTPCQCLQVGFQRFFCSCQECRCPI